MNGPLNRSPQGFTLIELMILVGLIGISLTLAFPSFSTFFERQRLNGLGDNLHFFMKLARAEAAKKSSNVYIKFTKTSATDWCIGLSDSKDDCNCGTVNDCAVDTVERVISSDDYSGVSFDSSTFTNNLISIQSSRGRSNSGQVNFSINTGSNKKDIRLLRSIMGRDILCSPSDTSMRYPKCP